MKKSEINDVIQWDIVNWSRAIPLWQKHLKTSFKGYQCLELGGNAGGLSLWMALNGGDSICSDLENPEEIASPLHNKYPRLNIKYEAINALEIPYSNHFDLVAFKSILGGVSRGGRNERKKETANQIHKSLKKGGQLIFSENLIASPLHQFFRKKFVKWGNDWNYLSIDEVDAIFEDFESFNYKTIGFFGAFGRMESQRSFLGRLDQIFDKVFPKRNHYILIGVATK